MMAETLARANHCFVISKNTKYCQTPIPNAKIVLVSEMANAVICPETGKSLKHQELITN
jgi:hypothetical protein